MSNRSSRCRPLSAAHRLLSAALVAVVASSTLGLAMVTSVVNAAPASAHTELVKITPAADAQLTTAPKEVVLEFSEAVSASFATVVVTTSAGVSVTRGKPTVVGARVTQELAPRMAAGGYRVAFRVVSNDGHPVAGESSFTLTLAPRTSPSTSSPSPSASPRVTPSVAATDVAPTPSPAADQRGGLSWSSLAGAGAVGLLVMGAGLLLWLRKRP